MNLPLSSVDIWIRIPVLFKDVKSIPNMSLNAKNNIKHGDQQKKEDNNDHGHGEDSKKRKLHDECINSKSESQTSKVNDIIVDVSTKSWTLWDNFRHTSNSDKRVYIALEFFNQEDLLVCTEGVL